MSKKITTPERSSKSTQGEIELKDLKKFMSPLDENISDSELVFHNIVMRLTDHSAMGDALWFEVGEELCRFSINEFCLITGMKCVGSTHLPLSNANFDNDDDAVKLSLLEATRAVICNTVENMMSSTRLPKNKFDKARYSIPGFPYALLVWAYETIPAISSKFTSKYEKAIPRMLSWTTAVNVRFDNVLAAFTADGESQLNCLLMMPTEEELKNSCVARLFLNHPMTLPQLPPPKPSVPRPSTDTNSEWREFQKEIRGQGQGQTAPHVSSSQEINVQGQRVESEAFKTTFPDIGAVEDIGV
ncbi:hypothetical protein TIFTF001_028734 [Ficus carica]|uniref:Uncharacterized protein n=1 Tax=Ficus carica TaxID=3494 RepID=A0AA88DQB9_FICCA|nr:hypothetical protein TIFTF001_028734 [Ficus carica]